MCDCRRTDIIQLWEKKKERKHVLKRQKHSLHDEANYNKVRMPL